ncbi:MAG: hypothetical protein WAQ05_05670, partial [Rubrivivax sp.]
MQRQRALSSATARGRSLSLQQQPSLPARAAPPALRPVCACGGACPACGGRSQAAGNTVSRPGEAAEREAD